MTTDLGSPKNIGQSPQKFSFQALLAPIFVKRLDKMWDTQAYIFLSYGRSIMAYGSPGPPRPTTFPTLYILDVCLLRLIHFLVSYSSRSIDWYWLIFKFEKLTDMREQTESQTTLLYKLAQLHGKKATTANAYDS